MVETTEVSDAAAPREGEIKQVTVLHSDLVLTTTGKLGDESRHHLIRHFSKLATAEVERYGGTIQFFGQNFMALFGAPVAHEDHGRRAVLAAQGILHQLAEEDSTAAQHGTTWQSRMGIDTGAVVVGGGADTTVGETTERAAALTKAAPPGAILVTRNTAKWIEPYFALVPFDAEGSIQRIQGNHASVDIEAPFAADIASPFIGRQRELTVLQDLRAQARLGFGQVVGLVGEAGSGKSRLLYEHRRTLRRGPISYLHGQCLSYGSGVPYLPLVDMIRKASRIGVHDGPAETAAKMRSSLVTVGLSPDEALPYFLRLLGIREGTEVLDELEPQALQARTFATMRRMLLTAAQNALLIMEIEDLHWIDETSADFLESLVAALPAAKILLITTYRQDYQPRWLDKTYATQIPMRRLTSRDGHELVGHILRRADLPEDLGLDILDKAEGNPFFLEELARALVEGTDGQGNDTIPDTIQGVLMARIDRLPDQQKRLLQTASVLGREFSLELLAELCPRDTDLEHLLQDLQASEFLYRTPSEDQTVLLFKHALTQEVAYQSLLSSRRQELHARTAAALEQLYAEHLEDAYDRLIHHYPRAGETSKTIHYLTLFAHRAARQYSHAEAAKALLEALEHAERLAAERRDRRVVEILLELAESLLPLARLPETLELCTRYGEYVERVPDPSLTAQYYFWLAHTHTYLGNQDDAKRCARRAIAAAQEGLDEATEGKACYVLGRDGFWSGQFSEGIEYSLRAVALLERSDEPWWQGQAYWVAGHNHYVLGEFEKGLQALERAYAIGEALDDYRLDSSWSIGYVYASLGDADQGIEQCQAGLERSKDPLNTAVAMGFLGYAYLQKPDLEKALETLSTSVDKLRDTGMQQLLGWFMAFLAEAQLETGHVDGALEMAAQALEVTRQADFHYGVGLAQQILGRVQLQRKDLDAATQSLDAATGTFEGLQVPFEVGRTQLVLARTAHAAGATEQAHGALRRAHGLFETLQVPVYVQRAEALAVAWDVELGGP